MNKENITNRFREEFLYNELVVGDNLAWKGEPAPESILAFILQVAEEAEERGRKELGYVGTYFGEEMYFKTKNKETIDFIMGILSREEKAYFELFPKDFLGNMRKLAQSELLREVLECGISTDCIYKDEIEHLAKQKGIAL